jgi:hypothetical protein
MAPDQLDQNARKKIRLLEKVLAKQAPDFGLAGSWKEVSVQKILELAAALDDTVAVGRPDRLTVEPWLRAFLEDGLPSKLLQYAVRTMRMVFLESSAGLGSHVAPAHRHLLGAWDAAQSLLFQFALQLATQPHPPKELARGFLHHLMPTNHGAVSEYLMLACWSSLAYKLLLHSVCMWCVLGRAHLRLRASASALPVKICVDHIGTHPSAGL